MMKDPFKFKKEAKIELYNFVDKYYKKLSKNLDGSIKEVAEEVHNNDVDALRHAYVSGRFTQVYSNNVANILGILNEYSPGGGISSPSAPKEENMDLWNNAVGRKYGKKAKTDKELFDILLKALKNGELIIDLNDKREYDGDKFTKLDNIEQVIVLQESLTGENLIFYDIKTKQIMSKDEFIVLIKNGVYPNYEIRKINNKETPISKKDNINSNNLS